MAMVLDFNQLQMALPSSFVLAYSERLCQKYIWSLALSVMLQISRLDAIKRPLTLVESLTPFKPVCKLFDEPIEETENNVQSKTLGDSMFNNLMVSPGLEDGQRKKSSLKDKGVEMAELVKMLTDLPNVV
ncbi:hypothetical protein ACH5RR_015337 [Cinchona calisaya]|uniref:Uncharacterized protein n=1 Tax=Cinchona calisaya TaxID=153742 RepID=A0ABD2ZU41_9GENT